MKVFSVRNAYLIKCKDDERVHRLDPSNITNGMHIHSEQAFGIFLKILPSVHCMCFRNYFEYFAQSTKFNRILLHSFERLR